MNLQRSYYEVLGVPPKATTDEIKKKYREMARKFHPDRPNVTDKAAGQKVFAQINRAYGVLSDPDKRAQYDATLSAEGAGAGGGTAAQTGGAAPPAGPLTPQQAANVTRLVADAETALLQNKLDNALSICQLVLKSDPRNAKALAFLGETLERQGKPTEAAVAYRHALQAAPSALLQAKLNRLQGAGGAPSGGTATAPARPPSSGGPNGRPPNPPPSSNGAGGPGRTAPTNGTGGSGAAKPRPEPEKPSGGLLSRLLGKK